VIWTPATRRQHSRAGIRYETDLTDAEWRLVEPLLPARKRTGRPLSWPFREIVNAIFYVIRGDVAWRLLPSDLPPKCTANRWFAAYAKRLPCGSGRNLYATRHDPIQLQYEPRLDVHAGITRGAPEPEPEPEP
jgi:transposase